MVDGAGAMFSTGAVLPEVPGLDLAAAYHPGGLGSEVLGDFYDVVPSLRGIVRRRDGRAEFLPTHGPVLGVLPDVSVTERRVQLRPGESLTLYTDGVTEARAPRSLEQFGPERLQKVVESAENSDTAADLTARLMTAVLDFGGTQTSDDVAILTVRVPQPT